VHAEAEVHDTPSKTFVVAPVGTGVVSIFQALPFQTSARLEKPANVAV
jgi:hypothetical protein